MTDANESSETNKQDDKFNLDKILVDEIGEGKYQVHAIALCGLVAFFFGLTANDFIFFAERLKTRCKIQECEENALSSFSQPWLENAIPPFGDAFDNCHRYASSDHLWNVSAECPSNLFDRSTTVKCSDYVYQYQNSAVYEFNLACDEWRWFLFGFMPLLGMTVSLPVAGFVSDRWGRRFALSITAFNMAWINAARYWANSYTVFILIGFLGSAFGSGCLSCCHTLALELVSPTRRMAAVSILTSCNCLGAVVKGLLAWTQPYWRDLILMLYLPMSVSIFYFWIAPESVRWLISKKRYEEAKTILLKASKMNGRVLSDNTLKKITEGVNSANSKGDNGTNLFYMMWKHKTILVNCIAMSVCSLSSAFMTKGLAISSVSISGNKYVNFCMVAVVAIPGLWTATFLNDKIGRRSFFFCLFWVSGFCQLINIFIPKGSHGIQLALYLLTKFCAAAISSTIVVYKAELFPTSYRSRLTGFTSIFARCGGFTALLIPALTDRVWNYLPNVLFSVLAFVSGVLLLFTPETLGASLPETMEDATRLGKDECSPVMDFLRRIIYRKHYVVRHDVGHVDVGKIS
ncbi:solute carrier family 22 member 3-like isoform X1 [Cydia pomonella]|uniref:solute carrier family 22 member 3-like isoform X1 n=1 Tax=Cydia pomonella TaxID=82600 RepID=UPI002ADE75FA|nr:solute carrier family 22 member 3-like isoform X1 [Cydia pomonella]